MRRARRSARLDRLSQYCPIVSHPASVARGSCSCDRRIFSRCADTVFGPTDCSKLPISRFLPSPNLNSVGDAFSDSRIEKRARIGRRITGTTNTPVAQMGEQGHFEEMKSQERMHVRVNSVPDDILMHFVLKSFSVSRHRKGRQVFTATLRSKNGIQISTVSWPCTQHAAVMSLRGSVYLCMQSPASPLHTCLHDSSNGAGSDEYLGGKACTRTRRYKRLRNDDNTSPFGLVVTYGSFTQLDL